jgi:hypothetical protein
MSFIESQLRARRLTAPGRCVRRFSGNGIAKVLGATLFAAPMVLGIGAVGGEARMTVDFGGPAAGLEEVVLFPFDDVTIPYRYRVQVGLVTATSPTQPHRRVLEKGKPGSPDGRNIKFYGSVRRVGDELRMWYIGSPARSDLRVCYATSTNGLDWEKPPLGLVEFDGNMQNNFVQFHRKDITAILILHEPEEPDPGRRFKMIYEVSPNYIGTAFSPDGLRWQDSPGNPIIKHNNVEPGGLTKFNGCYYLTGQGGGVGTKRALVTFQSYDFENWTTAVAIGLRRDIPPHREAAGMHAGEQVHLGAALWNRGNVLLGVYGQWHGETNDRRFLTMDLGLAVSNDALHYREPIPNFQIVSAYEINMTDDPGATFPAPSLEQGQAFENVGDQTFFYYSPWYGGSVCVAKWMRDRLGYFETVKGSRAVSFATQEPRPLTQNDPPKPASQSPGPHFISCPLQVEGEGARLFLNAAGLSDQTHMTVELLDKQFRPLPNYSGDDCIPVTVAGLRQPITWRNRKTVESSLSPFRVRVTWGGKRPEDAYVYALYLSGK